VRAERPRRGPQDRGSFAGTGLAVPAEGTGSLPSTRCASRHAARTGMQLPLAPGDRLAP
jgi:hypothetical protein